MQDHQNELICDCASSTLRACQPRTLSAVSVRTTTPFDFHWWSMGTWQRRFGAVVVDKQLVTRVEWLQVQFPDGLLDLWMDLVGINLFARLNCTAMVAWRWMFRERLKERRFNLVGRQMRHARFALIKGIEPQPYHARLVRAFLRLWGVILHLQLGGKFVASKSKPFGRYLQSWRCWMCSVVYEFQLLGHVESTCDCQKRKG